MCDDVLIVWTSNTSYSQIIHTVTSIFVSLQYLLLLRHAWFLKDNIWWVALTH